MVKSGTRQLNPYLVLAALCTALNGALRINMSVPHLLLVLHILYSLYKFCIVSSPSASMDLFMPLKHAVGGLPPSSSLFSNMLDTQYTLSFVAFPRLLPSLLE